MEGPPIPGAPWFKLKRPPEDNSRQTATIITMEHVSQTVTVSQKFSANPGVLVSGRRPERPGN